MARNRVEERASAIYVFLMEHFGEEFTRYDLLQKLGLSDGRTTRAAIRRAADMAADNGCYITVPVPENDHTISMTAMVDNALAPIKWLGRVERGIRARREQADRFVIEHLDDLDPGIRPMLELALRQRQQIDAVLDTNDDMTQALLTQAGGEED